MQNLIELFEKLKININQAQQEQIAKHVELLLKWNKAFNLTAITDLNEIIIKHVLDSAAVSPYLKGESFVDIGTGAGFPGLVLAVLNPDKNFILIDSVGKKIQFVNFVIGVLKLQNAKALKIHSKQFFEVFDGVVSRAVAPINDIISLSKHLLKENGKFYYLTGNRVDNVQNLPSQTIKLNIPNLDATRHLIIVNKEEL